MTEQQILRTGGALLLSRPNQTAADRQKTKKSATDPVHPCYTVHGCTAAHPFMLKPGGPQPTKAPVLRNLGAFAIQEAGLPRLLD